MTKKPEQSSNNNGSPAEESARPKTSQTPSAEQSILSSPNAKPLGQPVPLAQKLKELREKAERLKQSSPPGSPKVVRKGKEVEWSPRPQADAPFTVSDLATVKTVIDKRTNGTNSVGGVDESPQPEVTLSLAPAPSKASPASEPDAKPPSTELKQQAKDEQVREVRLKVMDQSGKFPGSPVSLPELANRMETLDEEVTQICEWGQNRQYVMKSFTRQLSSQNALKWSDLLQNQKDSVEVGTRERVTNPDFVRPWVLFLKNTDMEPVVRRKFLFIVLVAGTEAIRATQLEQSEREYTDAVAQKVNDGTPHTANAKE